MLRRIELVTFPPEGGDRTTVLHDEDSTTRAIARASGLFGWPGPRAAVSPRPEQHGDNDRTRFLEGKVLSLDGEVWSDTIENALREQDAIEQAMLETLRVPGILKWWRGGDTGEQLRNIVTNPRAGIDLTGIGGASAGIALNRVVGANLLGFDTAVEASGAAAVATGVAASFGRSGSGLGAAAHPVVPGGYLAARGIARIDAITAGAITNLNLRVYWYKADGTASATSFTTIQAQTNPVIGTAYEFVGFANVPADAAFGVPRILTSQTNPSTWVITMSGFAAFLVAPTTIDVPAYEDGDMPAFMWTGAPHASETVGPLDERAGLQAYVKFAGGDELVLEEGAAMVRYLRQLRQGDPRAFAQALRNDRGDVLSVGAGGLVFPRPFPWLFSSSGGGGVTVTNPGIAPTPPVTRIYGRATAPEIVLLTTGERIKLDGEIATGDYIELDHGARTVRLGGQTDRMNLLDDAVSTFFDIPPGTHTVRMLSGNFDGVAHVEVDTRGAYAG